MKETPSFLTEFREPALYKRVFLFILVFIQFYPIDFIFLPFTLRIALSFIGEGFFILQCLVRIFNNKAIYFNKRFLLLFLPLVAMSIMSALTEVVNATDDSEFLTYFKTPLLMISSAYFTIWMMRRFYGYKLSFPIIAYYCVWAVAFQLFLGMGMYFSPSTEYSILSLTKGGLGQMHNASAGRFKGLGALYMNLGVANGVGMMLISLLLKNADLYKIDRKIKNILVLLFIFISVLGNMQARTTLICAIIALCFLCFSTLQFNFRLIKAGILKVLLMTILCGLLIGFVVVYFPDFLAQQSSALDYGFELFNSVESGRGLRTGSSDMLSHMLTIWPSEDRTWLIGDGHYNVNDGNFYMNTDVGYARLVFYFGIFGMAFFYVYELMLLWITFGIVSRLRISFCIYLSVMLLFINLKSFTEYTHYFALFFIFNLLYSQMPYRKEREGFLKMA